MVLVYITEETERLRYIFDFIFSDILRTPYSLTTNEEEFLKSGLPRFTYGNSRKDGHLHIAATPLLFETEIRKQILEFSSWQNLTVFFSTEGGDLPFDIFAASFYLVSRYEEYLSHAKDRHDRYAPEDSAAFRGGFLQRPLINLWVEELKKNLKERFPTLAFPNPVFSFIPTIDIDNAYAYKYKGIGRITFSLLQKLLKFEFKDFQNRILVHLGIRKDPYDSYEKQFRIHETYRVKPLYFVLLGDYGKFDRNLYWKNKHLVRLVNALFEKGEVGIHPSYNSFGSEKLLITEKNRLEKITGSNVVRSRHHYLRFSIPETYNRLIRSGIREDYSMGYSTKSGFRASTCTPFYFFDVEQNKKTDLKIYPFAIMDSSLKYYQKLRSKEVIPYVRPMVQEVKKVGGNFVFVFHNESIGGRRNWKNWGDLYENIIKLANARE